MAWNLSTGAKLALLGKEPSVSASLIASTFSFGDGDGTGGLDTINDSGDGLAAVFAVDDFILVIGGTNSNTLVKAQSVAAGTIEVIAGSFTTEAAGTAIALVKISTGSLAEVFKNSTMDIRSGARPSTADLTESGTKLCTLSRGAGAFSAGSSANGLNIGEFSSTTIKRAIDPTTGVSEVWRGQNDATGTAGHVRWYANDRTTGASSSAVRMDGTVNTSGADVNLSTGTSLVVDIYSEVSDVSFTISGS